MTSRAYASLLLGLLAVLSTAAAFDLATPDADEPDFGPNLAQKPM